MTPQARDLCLAFNPSNQCAIVEQGDRAFIGTAPTLADIKTEHGANVSKAWLYFQLVDLCEFTGVKDKMQPQQISELASIMCATAYFLKISELMLFFVRFKAGVYGSFYGVVDPLKITQGLQQFITWRNEQLTRAQRLAQREAEKSSPEYIADTQKMLDSYARLKAEANQRRQERLEAEAAREEELKAIRKRAKEAIEAELKGEAEQ